MGNSILVQCEFITGSDVQGCLVVLVGRSGIDNATHSIRWNMSNTSTNLTELERLINPTYPLSCYQDVYAFDIESDGSIGTLAISGELDTSISVAVLGIHATSGLCLPNTVKHPPCKFNFLLLVAMKH